MLMSSRLIVAVIIILGYDKIDNYARFMQLKGL